MGGSRTGVSDTSLFEGIHMCMYVCECRSEYLQPEWDYALQGGMARCYQVRILTSRGSSSQTLHKWILNTCICSHYWIFILGSQRREWDAAVEGVCSCASAAGACMYCSVAGCVHKVACTVQYIYVCAYWE